MPTIPHIIPKFSKPIVDEIDEWSAKRFSFTEEELDITTNHNTKYRPDDTLNVGER